jgi:mRNA interferase RelE/StbE
LPAQEQERLQPKIDALATEPRPIGVIKLAGEEDLYRIRVGDYRIIYSIQDAQLLVLVVKIGH